MNQSALFLPHETQRGVIVPRPKDRIKSYDKKSALAVLHPHSLVLKILSYHKALNTICLIEFQDGLLCTRMYQILDGPGDCGF